MKRSLLLTLIIIFFLAACETQSQEESAISNRQDLQEFLSFHGFEPGEYSLSPTSNTSDSITDLEALIKNPLFQKSKFLLPHSRFHRLLSDVQDSARKAMERGQEGAFEDFVAYHENEEPQVPRDPSIPPDAYQPIEYYQQHVKRVKRIRSAKPV